MDPLLNNMTPINTIMDRYEEQKSIFTSTKKYSPLPSPKLICKKHDAKTNNYSKEKFSKLLSYACQQTRLVEPGQFKSFTFNDKSYVSRMKVKNGTERLQIFKQLDYIDQGSYSVVVKFLKVHTGKECVIKVNEKPSVLANEVNSLAAFHDKLSKHPEIHSLLPDAHIPFIAVPKNPVLNYPGTPKEMAVFELGKANLCKFIDTSTESALNEIMSHAKDIFTALLILEELETLHPDVKPSNFVLFETANGKRLKLIDFSGVSEFPPANGDKYAGSQKLNYHTENYIPEEIVNKFRDKNQTNMEMRQAFIQRQRTSFAMCLFEVFTLSTRDKPAAKKSFRPLDEVNVSNTLKKQNEVIVKPPKVTKGTSYNLRSTDEFQKLPDNVKKFFHDLLDSNIPSIKEHSAIFNNDALLNYVGKLMIYRFSKAAGL